MSIRTLNIKSNEGSLYAYLGWDLCRNQIETFETCKMTNSRTPVHPELCFNEAKNLHLCYSNKA